MLEGAPSPKKPAAKATEASPFKLRTEERTKPADPAVEETQTNAFKAREMPRYRFFTLKRVASKGAPKFKEFNLQALKRVRAA